MNTASSDNRCYDYTEGSWYERPEFSIISDWVADDSYIIDLGAGNGSLLHYIKERKNIKAVGFESAWSGVEFARNHGLDLIHEPIDKSSTFEKFAHRQFDYAICNVTLQMVVYPEVVLSQMKRISRFQIISFPNFAYFGNRLDLLLYGRMPRPMLHGYSWCNTGHIHQLSIKDFRQEIHKLSMEIVRTRHLGCFRKFALNESGNFFSKEGIFMTKER